MKPPKPEADVTRAELAKATGKSKSTIRRWEESGKLKPIVNERGVRLFRAEDVRALVGDKPIERLAQARTHVPSADNAGGELAAQIFERLERKVDRVKIVTELRVHPDVVMGFAARWSRFRRGIILTSEEVKAMENAVGTSLTGRGLDFLAQLRSAMRYWRRRCQTCDDARPAYCAGCVRARVAGVQARPGHGVAGASDNDEKMTDAAEGSTSIGEPPSAEKLGEPPSSEKTD